MIKDSPTHINEYYDSFISKYSTIKNSNIEKIRKNNTTISAYDDAIQKNPSMTFYGITFNPNDYVEYTERHYKRGALARKVAELRNKDGFRSCETFIFVAMVSKLLEDNAALERSNILCEKCIKVSYKQYRCFLQEFTNKIVRELIINGKGYVFSNYIGWIVINRVKVNKRGRKMLDFAKTKANKRKLIAEGKHIYNTEEAKWCKENNLEYKGIDYRVYRNDEYMYEIPLLDCKCKSGTQLEFTPSDYRGKGTRDKTNEELVQESDGNKEWICNLICDIKTKLTLCNQVDKMNYLNYIRDENQASSADWQAYRKDRQRL